MNQPQPTLDIDTTPAETPDQQERDRVREIYRARLAEKLKDPEFRKIEGFPIGTDEAILALSDPPFYTACPNPFLEEWLAENATPYDAATDDYHREPFAADVSEGRSGSIYDAHTYHTKVPHKAIMRYILHYTEPGDVVYDGFCGTGMTGVAAHMCGNKAQVEALGYRVMSDGTLIDAEDQQFSRMGARKAILNDLSPAATFIAYNYNISVDSAAFEREAQRILAEVEMECGWMYSTLHEASEAEIERIANAVQACSLLEELRELYMGLKSPRSPMRDPKSKMQFGRINYTVWSDIFICPSCGSDIVFWSEALDFEEGKVKDTFACPNCLSETTKRGCERSFQTKFDVHAQEIVTQSKQVPVVVNYSVGKKRHEREPDEWDKLLIGKIDDLPNDYWFPKALMMDKGENWGDTWRSGYCKGITRVHHFYTSRSLYVLSALRAKSQTSSIKLAMLNLINSYDLAHSTKMTRAIFKSGAKLVLTSHQSGAIYFPSLPVEKNILLGVTDKAKGFVSLYQETGGQSCIQVGSASAVMMKSSSVDYVFTDPPFGSNLQYSELNFLWESWLRLRTNNNSEAVSSKSQSKELPNYQRLMTQSFAEYYRILRPGRWMTVEFHNSANAVWNAIQEGLERVGFVVADVRTLDKQQAGFNGINAASAVKQDLVISCYKPRADFEQRFQQVKGQAEGVLEFVRQHLSMLPIAPLTKGGKLESVAERTRFLLFDRMIAYHLQHGAPIPMNSAAFYKLLEDQFTTRDEMYFLPDQAARYDALKSRGYETEQLSIFLQDEKSAVQWVRAALTETPQTLGDLTPKFMQELREWPKHEPRPELRDLLREYFIQDDSSVWRVPNPDDEKDIEALRKSAMLRLFQGYTREKGALKTFRKEAVMEGFKRCYETKQYGMIVAICEKIPAKVFQEIPEFVMFYDIAKDLAPEQVEQIEFVWE